VTREGAEGVTAAGRSGHPLYENIVPEAIRMLVLGSAEPSFYGAPAELKREIHAALRRLFAVWQEWGARYLGSFDDDLLMVGMPRARKHHFTIIYEVESLEMASAMMNLFRKEIDGVCLNHYVRFEAMLGQGFFPADEAAGVIAQPAKRRASR